MAQINFNRGAVSPAQCISDAWQIIKGDYLMFFGISIVAVLLLVPISCIPLLGPFVNALLIGPIMGGVLWCVLKRMRGEFVSFGEMFSGFNKFVPLMLLGLIQAIPGILLTMLQLFGNIAGMINPAGAKRPNGAIFLQSNGSGEAAALSGVLIAAVIVGGLLFLIFAFAWAITFYFVYPLVMEHNLSVGEAISTSAKAGWSNIGGLILLFILQSLVGLAGAFALCIGIFFVLPIIYASHAVAYRQVFPVSETFAPSAPPPPTDYGTDYGKPTGYSGTA